MLNFVPLREFREDRGRLRVCETGKELPFVPVRTFLISDVPEGAVRASHSVSCDLAMLVVSGQVTLKAVADGNEHEHVLGTNSGVAHIPAHTWILLSAFSPNTILLVHAEKLFEHTRYLSQPA